MYAQFISTVPPSPDVRVRARRGKRSGSEISFRASDLRYSHVSHHVICHSILVLLSFWSRHPLCLTKHFS